MELGSSVAGLRRKKGISRVALAQKAGLSARFLADVEAGRGNISLLRLSRLCAALEVPMATLIASLSHAKDSRMIALIGLRGAGKTTIGKKIATRLRIPFVELDELIEKAAGLTLQNIFEVHGEEYYRRLEHEVLLDYLTKGRPSVLAAGGGIVTREETYELLQRHCQVVWLKADPVDHWNRVLRQDPRPMANDPNAMDQLQSILRRREPLYSRADFVIDTSKLGIAGSVRQLLATTQQRDDAIDAMTRLTQ
jgi:XRE family transcriptional regulator, aerobic/anaerobic benzoate catabolism transcriptional regulator